MTLGEIRTFVKGMDKQTTTELDTIITTMINASYRRFANRKPWRQLLVEGATFNTVAGTEFYALPVAFGRMVANSVIYDAEGAYNGRSLTFAQPEQAALYKSNYLSQTQPLIWSLSHATAGTGKRLQLLPIFTDTDKVVRYDYWKRPVTLVNDGDTPEVDELSDAIAYDALVQVAIYFNRDGDMIEQYRRESESHYKAAFATIANG